jgi:hypothetical protein
MSEMGSDISDQVAVPRFWNPMEIYDLVGYIRPHKNGSEMERFGMFEHFDIF